MAGRFNLDEVDGFFDRSSSDESATYVVSLVRIRLWRPLPLAAVDFVLFEQLLPLSTVGARSPVTVLLSLKDSLGCSSPDVYV